MTRGAVTVFAAGLAGIVVAIVVTKYLHDHPRFCRGVWSHRVGRTRFRRANLPVGALTAFVLAILVPSAVAPLIAAGVTMGVVAVGYRYLDPLPGL